MPRVLRFGVPSLDKLFGARLETLGISLGDIEEKLYEYGIDLPEDKAPSSICIIGPDGTGKSVLGLHLASTYMADCMVGDADHVLPTVLYVSTDLKFEMAKKMWKNFWLDFPYLRRMPFDSVQEENRLKIAEKRGVHNKWVKLTSCQPLGREEMSKETAKPLSTYLAKSLNKTGQIIPVYFVDLASTTAGDDWGFVNRILSVMQPPKKDHPPHLMVIDSVEGFETLVGDRDAFGEAHPRRSRIAQVMRSAGSKCHIAFITEEAREGEQQPEEFVVDAVIRLRRSFTQNYVRRTIEIEKARGQSHVRGQHPYLIRSGAGSTTGTQENPDDPELLAPEGAVRSAIEQLSNLTEAEKPKIDDRPNVQSYVHVCPSLHRFSRDIMESKVVSLSADLPKFFAAFGIPYLDEILDGAAEKVTRAGREGVNDPDWGNDRRGLPVGKITALIGNPETQKTPLGQAFLSRCFTDYARRFAEIIKLLRGCRKLKLSELKTRLRNLADCRQIDRLRGSHKVGSNAADRWIPLLQSDISSFVTRTRKISEGNKNLKRLCRAIDTKVAGEPIPELVKAASWLLGAPFYPNDGVPVMLTTRDEVHSKVLAKDFMKWLTKPDLGDDKIPDLRRHYEQVLKLHMEEYCICRRLEIHDMPSAVLIHIIQRAVEAAQCVLAPKHPSEYSTEQRAEKSWGIRVVIDDFSILQSTYTEAHDDPLFLPFLVFYLRREGVTTLIIDTQSGRPEAAITDPLDSELRAVVDHRIYTWRFSFYGENRIAVAPIPPIAPDMPAVVRELRREADDTLTVDPHFELYSGIEEGDPRPVPLEVRLFEETTAFRDYIARENARYLELFTPVAKAHDNKTADSVILGIPPDEYDNFWDFCCLQRDTKLDFTMVLQVDEFWELQRPKPRRVGGSRRSKPRRAGGFRSQWDYLRAMTSADNDMDLAADPFAVFQETELSTSRDQARDPSKNIRQRIDFFDYPGCVIRDLSEEDKDSVDRIPFMWDFGFLLCKRQAWEDTISEKKLLPILSKSKGIEIRVKEIWERMPKALDRWERANGRRPSWREFLEACHVVAQEQSYKVLAPVTSFDLSITAGPTLSCLVLEVWASEIYDRLKQNKKKNDLLDMLEKISKRSWRVLDESGAQRLIDWLENYELELFMTWLLLVEVLDISALASAVRKADLRVKEAETSAVAIRHWYKTASSFSETFSSGDPVVPVGLPGHFSIRGDWFLSVAGGSRSGHLADRALDLLCSKRANHNRLEHGLGLPTRAVVTRGSEEALRTKLLTHDKGDIGFRTKNVPYGNLLKIGGPTSSARAGREEFYWFWRSGLKSYHRHARIWQDWLASLILWWERMRYIYPDEWTSGFKRYDSIAKEIEKLAQNRISQQRFYKRLEKKHLGGEAWIAFKRRVDGLREDLLKATLKEPRSQ